MNDLKDWIALNMIGGIGPVRFHSLVNHFGSPKEVLSATVNQLSEVKGIGEEIAKNIVGFRSKLKVDEELSRIERLGIEILCIKDKTYPVNLKAIFDPPPIIYVKGNILPDDRLAISIVGSRMATTYGKIVTGRLSAGLATRGITVVSGLARGIDSAAHISALKVGGRTIAVLGCGIDLVYPPENKSLFEQIVCSGAIITEFPLSTPPDKFNFPQRNRLISGLSLGVVVVEAPIRSGSLITADYALEQGREVFAVPGLIDSNLSKGTHNLIKQGAKLVDSCEDILEEFGGLLELLKPIPSNHRKDVTDKDLSSSEETVLHLLSNEPKHIDSIIRVSPFSSHQVVAILMQLEIKGLIQQIMGKRFLRC